MDEATSIFNKLAEVKMADQLAPDSKQTLLEMELEFIAKEFMNYMDILPIKKILQLAYVKGSLDATQRFKAQTAFQV